MMPLRDGFELWFEIAEGILEREPVFCNSKEIETGDVLRRNEMGTLS